MKKEITLFLLLALFLLFGAVEGSAQEKSFITVRASELNNRVVILDVLKAGKAYELQCNQGVPSCGALKNGRYQLVELPKNFGMYECKDVEVYPESAVTPDKDKKLGEYCLVEK
jgi:hypothetical protein